MEMLSCSGRLSYVFKSSFCAELLGLFTVQFSTKLDLADAGVFVLE